MRLLYDTWPQAEKAFGDFCQAQGSCRECPVHAEHNREYPGDVDVYDERECALIWMYLYGVGMEIPGPEGEKLRRAAEALTGACAAANRAGEALNEHNREVRKAAAELNRALALLGVDARVPVSDEVTKNYGRVCRAIAWIGRLVNRDIGPENIPADVLELAGGRPLEKGVKNGG